MFLLLWGHEWAKVFSFSLFSLYQEMREEPTAHRKKDK